MSSLQKLRSEFIQALSGQVEESEAAAMFRHLRADVPVDKLAHRIHEILPGLRTGRPFQYVTGRAWFYDMPLFVNESVLIPRPETEELVHQILKDVKSHHDALALTNEKTPHSPVAHPALRILDIGTGSGCIALALKKNLPQAELTAMDVSDDALEVARKNAESLGLQIEFMRADVLEWELVIAEEQTWDVIVSNPPYITPAEKAEMEAHVLDFEPELALFAPEEAPLLFYQHIADLASKHLRPGGNLYFEINQALGSNVRELLEKKGFHSVRLLKDMQVADRMVKAIRK